MNSSSLARTGLIAAVYASFTLIALVFLQGLAWGPVQFRVSECVCVLALFVPEGVAGLALGCLIANLINIPLAGTGLLGSFDVIFGSAATLFGALWMWHFRSRVKIALLGPVIFNALIVPAYLPILLTGLGYYTIPFTSIALDGFYPLMYLFGVLATGLGEALVMYLIGLPLAKGLGKTKLVQLS